MIDVDPQGEDAAMIFVDLFRVRDLANEAYIHVASADASNYELTLDATKNGEYILRVQSELLRGGIYRITVRRSPILAFPVSGKDKRAIGSLFGVPRDGGKRRHHGVDIFAKKYTPIVAPVEGIIKWSGEKGIGGRVVWMLDTKNDQTLYFAHLNDIYVRRGDRVSVGDTLGTVGNTGNAMTTPPHLHFGIYDGGPLDPYYFIADVDSPVPDLVGTTHMLGRWIRTKRGSILRSHVSSPGPLVMKLDDMQVMKVTGVLDRAYRVELPDGLEGFVNVGLIEEADEPLSIETIAMPTPLLETPGIVSSSKRNLLPGNEMLIHGSHQDYLLVSDRYGLNGWIAAP